MKKYWRLLCCLTVLGCFSVTSQAIAGGFSSTCSNLYLDGSWLGAYCGDGHGSGKWTGLDLNRFIINNHGNLYWQSNGGYSHSARNCHINSSGLLFCQLNDGHGHWPEQAINLNDHLTNAWGNLTYN